MMVSTMSCRDRITLRGGAVALLVLLTVCLGIPGTGLSADTISPALLSDVVLRQADQLAAVESDAGAMALFTTTAGPALGLKDVAGTLAAKGLPAKLANELRIAELTLSTQQLMAALAAWQLATAVSQAGDAASGPMTSVPPLPSSARQEWMKTGSQVPALADLFRVMSEQPAADQPPPALQLHRRGLLLAASRVAFDAHQRALAAWWALHEWKDRIRQSRGQTRLCGTWQWVIHNHQKHHQEQKLSLLFPPPGKDGTGIAGLTELLVLGDTVYLRWEIDGRTQEDSLLFSKEGNRLEGTFVNNQGGWGSISGKRTASCTLE